METDREATVARYSGKNSHLVVAGEIASLDRAPQMQMGRLLVRLKTGRKMRVTCTFGAGAEGLAAAYKVGQQVVLQGDFSPGTTQDEVFVSNCLPLAPAK
jgi:hypothetical protein